LPPEIRSQIPLVVASAAYAPPSAAGLLELIRRAVPDDSRCRPPSQILDLLEPFANLSGQYASLTKEARAAAALHCTTTGLLAGVHGVSHLDRATLSLLLCQRWGGDVAPTDHTFLARLQTLVGPETSWWTNYIGRIGQLLGAVYPVGRISHSRARISLDVQTQIGKVRHEFAGFRIYDVSQYPPRAVHSLTCGFRRALNLYYSFVPTSKKTGLTCLRRWRKLVSRVFRGFSLFHMQNMPRAGPA